MVANHQLNSKIMKNDTISNGHSNRTDARILQQWEATEQEFNKLIAEQECFEILLREERVKNRDLEIENKKLKKELRKQVLRLEGDIQTLRKSIAQKEGALEEANKEIVAQKAVVDQLKFKIKNAESIRQPQVPTEPPPLITSVNNNNNTNGDIKYTESPIGKPPRPFRPSMSSPLLIKQRSLQDELYYSRAATPEAMDKPVINTHVVTAADSLEADPLSSTQEPESMTGVQKLQRCRRAATIVGKLIQGFEAVAAANTSPQRELPTPRRRLAGGPASFKNFTFSLS